jgi:hypothetical protein
VAAVLSSWRNAAGRTVLRLFPESAVAEGPGLFGVPDDVDCCGSAAVVESPLPHAVSDPRASGTTAAKAAFRRVRLRMGFSRCSVWSGPLPVSGTGLPACRATWSG